MRRGGEERPEIKALVKALQSRPTRDHITEAFKGTVIRVDG